MYATTYLIIEYECPEIAHMGIHNARRQPAQNNNNMYVLPSLSMPIAFLARFDFYSKFDLLFYSCPSFFFFSLSTPCSCICNDPCNWPLQNSVFLSWSSDSHSMPLNSLHNLWSYQFPALVLSFFLSSFLTILEQTLVAFCFYLHLTSTNYHPINFYNLPTYTYIHTYIHISMLKYSNYIVLVYYCLLHTHLLYLFLHTFSFLP